MGTDNKNCEGLDIKKVIENKNVEIVFEPVVSIVKKSVIGLEAKWIGSPDDRGNIIGRDTLIKQGDKEGITIDIDRLYREKAIERFSSVYSSNRELLLFLDIDISIIDKYIGSGILLNVVNQFHIEPRNIVLEIVESKIDDIEAMQKFINFYRSRGFLIGLKDLGSGFSNLDRIFYVEPDIIKINSTITNEISYDYYKQEIFKSLVNLCKKIGSLIIVDDVESEEEAMIVMELGADMLQGNVFTENVSKNGLKMSALQNKIEKTAVKFIKYMSDEINAKEATNREYGSIITNILNELSNSGKQDFDDKIEKMLDKFSVLECIYILDENGKQVSDTVTKCRNMLAQKALIFQPAKKGTDHSLKKYYYFPKSMSLNRYITEPYISLATGNLCITISSEFKSKDGEKFILCIDFNPDYITL